MTGPAPIPVPTPKRRVHPAVWAVLGAVVALAVAGGIYLFTRPGGIAGDPNRGTAISLCEEAVRAQLKAPATAQFSGETYTANDPVWTVTGNVDAQNGFGALIRSTWRCTLNKTAGGQLSVALANITGGG